MGGALLGQSDKMLGVTCEGLACHPGGVTLSPSRCMLRKPELSVALMSHLTLPILRIGMEWTLPSFSIYNICLFTYRVPS